MTNINIKVFAGEGLGYNQLDEAAEFNGGIKLYISGQAGQTDGSLVVCSKYDLSLKIELTFTIKNGATSLGFAVSEKPEDGISSAKDIAVECGSTMVRVGGGLFKQN